MQVDNVALFRATSVIFRSQHVFDVDVTRHPSPRQQLPSPIPMVLVFTRFEYETFVGGVDWRLESLEEKE